MRRVREMFTKTTESFHLEKNNWPRGIQRTYDSTWTVLTLDIQTNNQKSNIKHFKADGTEIKVYPLDFRSEFSFQLVSESKIFIPDRINSRIWIIDLLKGSTRSFPFPLSFSYLYRMFSFSYSGFLCLSQQKKNDKSRVDWYFSQSSLEEDRPFLEYRHEFKLNQPRSRFMLDPIYASKGNQSSLIISPSVQGNRKVLLLHDVVFVQGRAESRVRYLYEYGWECSLWQLSQNVYLNYSPFRQPQTGPVKTESIFLTNAESSKHEQVTIQRVPYKSTQGFFIHPDIPHCYRFEDNICFFVHDKQQLKVYDAKYSRWSSISYHQIEHPSYSKERYCQNWEKNLYDRRFRQSYLNPSVLFEYYIKTDRSITINTLEWVRKQNMFMQFLLALNEDFDDDLLFDALGLIGCI